MTDQQVDQLIEKLDRIADVLEELFTEGKKSNETQQQILNEQRVLNDQQKEGQ